MIVPDTCIGICSSSRLLEKLKRTDPPTYQSRWSRIGRHRWQSYRWRHRVIVHICSFNLTSTNQNRSRHTVTAQMPVDYSRPLLKCRVRQESEFKTLVSKSHSSNSRSCPLSSKRPRDQFPLTITSSPRDLLQGSVALFSRQPTMTVRPSG